MAKPSYNDDTLLARWLSGELSAAEEADLRQRPEIKDYERMLGNISRMQPPAFDEAAEFSRLSAARSAPSTQKPHLRARQKSRRLNKVWYAAAASVALVCVAWLFLRHDPNNLEALNGDSPKVETLKDGSTISLNDGSTLNFAQTEDQRLAMLSGEGFFDVEKSEVPFIVQTELGRVTVVGTSFNVYSRAGRMTVSCKTGQVRVKFDGSDEAYPLTPGNSVSINATGEVIESINGDEHFDWLEADRSVFIDRPLSEILTELERQYDLEVIRSPKMDLAKTYRTIFPNDNVDRALEVVTDIMGYTTYNQRGNQITPLPQ